MCCNDYNNFCAEEVVSISSNKTFTGDSADLELPFSEEMYCTPTH